MTWLKVSDFKPPTQEVILFRHRNGNEHYGVLCGNLAKKEHQNKFWCHIFQKTFLIKDISYWCEIPINKHLLRSQSELMGKVNAFLWDKFNSIESTILEEFKQHQESNPDWPAENFVGIAVRNCLYRMMQIMRFIED